MSAKLTPAAATRIKTSPWPGLGTGASVIKRMSCGPSDEVCCRARMVAGTLTVIDFLRLASLRPAASTHRRHVDRGRPKKESLSRAEVPLPVPAEQVRVAVGDGPLVLAPRLERGSPPGRVLRSLLR